MEPQEVDSLVQTPRRNDANVRLRTEVNQSGFVGMKDYQKLWDRKHKGSIGHVQKTENSWWKRKIAHPISKIDDYVEHIFREHNQEADHWANLGAEGQKNYSGQRQ